jgi:hypothetical protein
MTGRTTMSRGKPVSRSKAGLGHLEANTASVIPDLNRRVGEELEKGNRSSLLSLLSPVQYFLCGAIECSALLAPSDTNPSPI